MDRDAPDGDTNGPSVSVRAHIMYYALSHVESPSTEIFGRDEEVRSKSLSNPVAVTCDSLSPTLRPRWGGEQYLHLNSGERS